MVSRLRHKSRDLSSQWLLAVPANDMSEFLFRHRGHQFGGGDRAVGVEPHVQRPVVPEGKAALGFIHLE